MTRLKAENRFHKTNTHFPRVTGLEREKYLQLEKFKAELIEEMDSIMKVKVWQYFNPIVKAEESEGFREARYIQITYRGR